MQKLASVDVPWLLDQLVYRDIEVRIRRVIEATAIVVLGLGPSDSVSFKTHQQTVTTSIPLDSRNWNTIADEFRKNYYIIYCFVGIFHFDPDIQAIDPRRLSFLI